MSKEETPVVNDAGPAAQSPEAPRPATTTADHPNAELARAWLDALMAVSRHYSVESSPERVRVEMEWLSNDVPLDGLVDHMARQLGLGVAFARFGENLFLADHVPAGCFSGPPLPPVTPPESRKPERPGDPADRAAAPGSFYMDMERAAGSRLPESLKRRARNGRPLDPKRLKRGKWSREKPPWRK